MLPEGVVMSKPPTKTLNQNFCNSGDSWMFNAMAKIAVARPRAVPRP